MIMPKLPLTDVGKRKVGKVLAEFKGGTLRDSAGAKVKKQKQAIAISLSEGRKAEKKSV